MEKREPPAAERLRAVFCGDLMFAELSITLQGGVITPPCVMDFI